ncbi:hypothetical protein KPH14_011856 [Odynerus spinipes]|uniref:Uncharacterized protein n=1 Tax=Odynerus spinipes TaxID=1348599 RepID=A0AAD9RE20_9HYME|nr:hypothetical protein KPH14_011856 [Odynerus spinipes]
MLQFSGKRFVSISIAGEHSGVRCCVHEWFGLEPETMWIHLRELSITNCVALVVWLWGLRLWGHGDACCLLGVHEVQAFLCNAMWWLLTVLH